MCLGKRLFSRELFRLEVVQVGSGGSCLDKRLFRQVLFGRESVQAAVALTVHSSVRELFRQEAVQAQDTLPKGCSGSGRSCYARRFSDTVAKRLFKQKMPLDKKLLRGELLTQDSNDNSSILIFTGAVPTEKNCSYKYNSCSCRKLF